MTNNRPSGFANPWFQLGLNIICVVLYELLLKAGAKATADPGYKLVMDRNNRTGVAANLAGDCRYAP